MTVYSVEAEGKPRFVALGVAYDGYYLVADECYAAEPMRGNYVLRDNSGNMVTARIDLDAGAYKGVMFEVTHAAET